VEGAVAGDRADALDEILVAVGLVELNGLDPLVGLAVEGGADEVAGEEVGEERLAGAGRPFEDDLSLVLQEGDDFGDLGFGHVGGGGEVRECGWSRFLIVE
jgi:hypothetical protein